MKRLLKFKRVCTFHDGGKQGIDQQIFNRKSISRKITHPQSLFYLNKIPCLHPSWKVHTCLIPSEGSWLINPRKFSEVWSEVSQTLNIVDNTTFAEKIIWNAFIKRLTLLMKYLSSRLHYLPRVSAGQGLSSTQNSTLKQIWKNSWIKSFESNESNETLSCLESSPTV